ncbi:MFS transporter, partial [Acinetobacter baumannii]
ARALQGIGSALMIPQSLAIIAAAFPEERRGRAIGTWAAASALTTALGPTLGGVLVDLFSWRAAFLINLPVGGAVLWLTLARV